MSCYFSPCFQFALPFLKERNVAIFGGFYDRSQSAEDQKGGAEVTLGSSILTHLFLQMEKLRTREEK